MITELKPNQVFVFGSNLAGHHGKGAAKTALKWGAVYGQGTGIQGQTYAIPTKDRRIQTLPLRDINRHVVDFIHFANSKPDLEFLVTAIGCGLAGYKKWQIAPMFKYAPKNVILPKEFQHTPIA